MYSGNLAHQGNNDDSDHQAQSIRDNDQIQGGERVAPTRGATGAWDSAYEEDDLLLRWQIAVEL